MNAGRAGMRHPFMLAAQQSIPAGAQQLLSPGRVPLLPWPVAAVLAGAIRQAGVACQVPGCVCTFQTPEAPAGAQ